MVLRELAAGSLRGATVCAEELGLDSQRNLGLLTSAFGLVLSIRSEAPFSVFVLFASFVLSRRRQYSAKRCCGS